MMDLSEELIRACADAINGKQIIEYQGESLDFENSFRRATMHDLVKEATGKASFVFYTSAYSILRQQSLIKSASLLSFFDSAYRIKEYTVWAPCTIAGPGSVQSLKCNLCFEAATQMQFTYPASQKCGL